MQAVDVRPESTGIAMQESALIRRFFAPLAAHLPGAAGLQDDGAVLPGTPLGSPPGNPPGTHLAMTADTMIAGVHFLPQDPPVLIAHRLLRVNLSDLAAMGAVPYAYMLCAALDATAFQPDWLEAFCAGLAEDQARYGLHLAGGDTTRTPGPTTLSVTALGHVPASQRPTSGRRGAQPGDVVCVSGTLGDAAMGLDIARGARLPCLSAADAAHLLHRLRLPEPRLALGQHLRGLATACMDISDGTGLDLTRLCVASGVSARVDVGTLPRSPALDTVHTLHSERARMAAVAGGDDYELLFTLPAAALPGVQAWAASQRPPLPITAIGIITASTPGQPPVAWVEADGTPWHPTRLGYDHGLTDG